MIDEQSADCTFTRCGRFTLDDNRRLTLRIGGKSWLVQPAINVPAEASAVAISPNGAVLVREGNTCQSNAWGQIQLALFDHPGKLRRLAPAIFDQTAASGQPRLTIPGNDGAGLVCQGALRRNDR